MRRVLVSFMLIVVLTAVAAVTGGIRHYALTQINGWIGNIGPR
jgi:hypothetical protein